jgi:DUF1680 family protein
MRLTRWLFSSLLLFSGSVSMYAQAPLPKVAHDYPIKPVPFTEVHLNDVFWAPRIETNRSVTIPFAFGKCEETGRIENFLKAADAIKGLGYSDKLPGFPFDDTDIYKVIEGASYTLSVHPDPKLDAYIDSLIEKIAAAQEKDGYLYTARTMNPAKPHSWSGAQRWEKEEDGSHELYDLGHLYEAAVAHYQATGKRNLLNIAIKTADLLVATFGPGKQTIWPGHQITEMGLVKLYRVTGNQSYLDLAKFMLDSRGPGGKPYNQAHLKVVDQDEAVGHAVRATYMYSGIADVAAITGNQDYLKAIDKIWENVASKKLYITGGIGSTSDGSEGFGINYELPNMTAYNETCASIGNDYWNHRLFLLHGDAKYIDVMERTLYNGLISGVSLDGKTFFYPNPLESNGQHTRSPWFGCACCPGNVTRFMASVPGYVYAQHDDILFVNLYAQGKATVKLDSGPSVQLAQETRYPWDGNIKLTVTPDKAGRFTMKVRIPGWARNEAVPSDLYRFTDNVKDPVVLKVNGKPVAIALDKGYAGLTREWKAGDVVELSLPMPVRRVVANPQVAADRDRVALQRGPIVYALEWPDNGGHVRNLVLPASSKLNASFRPDLLNGVEIITGSSEALSYDAEGKVKRAEQQFTAIPYYAWANRGAGQMTVWVPTTEAVAHPAPEPIISMKSKATSSSQGEVWGVNDGDEPASSSEHGSEFVWFPPKGATQWVEYAFPEESTVSETQVYWVEGGARGRSRVPASWRVLYRDGNEWKPVEATGPFGVEKDRYNRVTFKPVKTTGIRLEATLQPNASAGIQEWKVK